MEHFRKPRFWQRLRMILNLPRSGRLIWGLLRDGRVPLINKALFVGLTLIYFIIPIDFIPDLMPFIGQIDDLTVLLLLVDRFVASSPGYVVREYMERFY